MKDLIEIDRGIEFCHKMQTMSSRHCVGDGICASPTFRTNCENKKKEQKDFFDLKTNTQICKRTLRNIFVRMVSSVTFL